MERFDYSFIANPEIFKDNETAGDMIITLGRIISLAAVFNVIIFIGG